MSLARALGIASAGRIAALLALVAAASAAGGFWSGQEWQRGQQAQARVVDLQADADTLRAAATTLRQQSLDAAQDMRTAARRMDAISAAHWNQINALDVIYDRQLDVLDAHLQSVAAAELRACRIGAFGMRIWAAAASGNADLAAALAAEPDSDAPQNGVSSRAAGTDDGRGAGRAAGIHPRGAAVPPVPDAARGSGEGSD